MKCAYCGNNTDERVCPCCGAILDQPDPPIQRITTQAPQQVVSQASQPTIVINNTITTGTPYVPYPVQVGNPKNKMVALILCIFLGVIGAHKFYEGKIGMGILYLFTGGLFAIGWIVDIITLATKPSTYYL